MKNNWVYSLWTIINLLVFIAVLSLWIAAPEYKTLNISLTVFAVSLGLLLAFIRKDEIKDFTSTKYFKKILYHSINVLLVFSILGLVNYLGYKNYREFDVTAEKRNSLTEQSKKVLELLDAPLAMTIFSRREEWAGMLNLLRLYEAQSKFIQLKAIDTDLRPDLVKEKNITENGTVAIEYKGKESFFRIQDELSVTNALLRVLRTEQIVIYMVRGHGEIACQEQGMEGMSQLCGKITTQNYRIDTIDLSRTQAVPADASAVIIAGPARSFLPQETQQLKAYLEKGGNLLLALAPSFSTDIYANLIALAAPYGLALGRDIVIDRLSTIQGAEATIPIVNKYDPHHPITAGFEQRTIFPLSSSVKLLPGKDSAHLLAFTSDFPGSWAETDLKGVTEGKAEYQEGKDQKGPIGLLGVGEDAASDGKRESRLALLGSSSFLINAYQNQSANTVLFLNTVSWLVNDEGIISFNRPGIEEYPVILSAQHLNMIFVISILFVPIIFFGAGIFVYRRQRLL